MTTTQALAELTLAKAATAAATFAECVTLAAPALPPITTTPMLQLYSYVPVHVPTLRSGRTASQNCYLRRTYY